MSETPLSIDFSPLPLAKQAVSGPTALKILQKYEEWTASDFAGFRNILRAGSAEAPDLALLKKTAQEFQNGSSGKKIKNFVVLGTGGSSLGGEAILRALRSPLVNPQFFFLDNNDPAFFHSHLEYWNPEETLFYAVSKSGKTPETISQMLVAIEWMEKKLSPGAWKKHFVLCTDPAKGDFRALAQKHSLRCLDVPSSVGGRFSVLTPVGLFPAAFAGLKVENFLEGAQSLVSAWEKIPLEKNPCFQTAHALVSDASQRPITIHMPYSSQLQAFSRWFCQLWAESLGKEEKGLTPYPAIGTTDQHSQMQLYMEGPRDKNIAFVEIKNFAQALPLQIPSGCESLGAFQELKNKSMADLFSAEFHATRDAITKQEIPNFTISLETLNEKSLGALFYFWEWTTLYAGALLEINPFDQPGVEAAKILTKQYLAKGK